MWRHDIPKSKITCLSEVSVPSDKRPYRTSTVKRWIIALVFANWTVLALEEVFISMYRISWAIIFHFNSKTQWQMFLLLYGRHICAPQKDTNMASPYKLSKFEWHTSANNARMKISKDLSFGDAVNLSIIYQIPDSWLYSLNGYDF